MGDGWNEIVVDGRGNIYVNSVGFRFGEEEFRPGVIVLITPDGSVRQVADDIAFPNGMVVTPDNSTLIIAESWASKLTAFDIAVDGSLSNRRVWAEVGGDGRVSRTDLGRSPTIPLTFVRTDDLASYLAAAADAPGVDGERIDIGWDRPVSMQEMARVAGGLLGREIRVRTIPTGLANGASAVIGRFSPMARDMGAMMCWFQTGRYVADPASQREVLGEVPSAEEAIAGFVRKLGHPVAG